MLKKEKGMKKLLVGEKNKKMDVREKEGKEKNMETQIWTQNGGIKTAVWKEKEHVEGKENKTAIWKEKVQVPGMEKRREKRAATARKTMQSFVKFINQSSVIRLHASKTLYFSNHYFFFFKQLTYQLFLSIFYLQ